jgi:hypothetical protein
VIAGTALVLLVALVAGMRGIALDPTPDEQEAVSPVPAPT